MKGIESRLDGSTLVVRIPMRFQRRRGRKRIVAPDGSEITPTTKPQPDGTLVKALTRAWRWQRMLDEGVFTTVREIGEAEGIDKGYVSRILRLALLAPDIVEAILAGPTDQARILERPERPLFPIRLLVAEPGMASVCAEAIRVVHPTGRRAWRAPTR